MPSDDSNSQGVRRTDSHDEQSRENVTTAERKDISQKNAPSPGKNEFHGEDHTGLRKPPSRRRPKKNRRETTTLGNKWRQPPPEGNTCCQTRRRPPVPSTNRPIRPRGENYDQSTNPGDRRERMHHYSLHHDGGASENFIDKAYAEASGIPMQQKTMPRRVLTVDGGEVTAGR